MTETPSEETPDTGAFREAQKLLDYLLQAGLDTLDSNLPTKRYVTVGQAAWDCEQVTATMLSVTTGLPGAQTPGGQAIVNCPLPWQIVIELAVVRCAPKTGADGTPPSAKQLLDAARIAGKDTHLLQLAAESRAAEQFGAVACTISYPPPSGGMMASAARITVAISS